MSESITKDDIILYLSSIRMCNIIHKKIFGKKASIEIPSMLSESLVRLKFDLIKYSENDKKYDAEKIVDGEKIYYEIKATSTSQGTTTINVINKPQHLIWAFFDFNNDKIVVKTFENFDKKTTIGEFLTEEGISNLKRKDDGKKATKDSLFSKIFIGDNDDRSTFSLHNLLWNEDLTKSYNMSDLDELPK